MHRQRNDREEHHGEEQEECSSPSFGLKQRSCSSGSYGGGGSSSYGGAGSSSYGGGPRVYVFTINILKVTRIPSPLRLSCSAGSSSLRLPSSKRTLKITVLHGSKQKEIGEFEIVKDECLIDQRISCRLFCARDDDLGKLHIYIDQACSSGLAGHIALDLKEFLEDMDSEVYIKYPLCASSTREGYIPKLKLTLECTCLGNPENLFIPDMDTIIHHRSRSLDMKCVLEDRAADDDALALRRREVAEASGESCPEMQLLDELETVLLKLDTKLKNFVATCKAEDEKDIPVDSSTVMKRTIVEDKPEDCSDCAVCCKGPLADKLEGMSSSGMTGFDARQAPSPELAPTPSSFKKKSGGEQAGDEQQKQVQTPRPNVLRSLVGGALGGAMVFGLSLLAVRSINNINSSNDIRWRWRRHESSQHQQQQQQHQQQHQQLQ